MLGTAFVAAFLYGACVSASVLCMRLAHGPWAVGAGRLGVTLAAAALVAHGRGPQLSPSGRASHWIPGAQLLGLLTAITLTHLLIRPVGGSLGLVERPIQWVNDGVLAVAILLLVWSYAASASWVRATLPLLSFVLVGVYALTAVFWHADPFPGFAVQNYVVGQVTATAAILFGWYVLLPDARSSR